MVRNSEFQKRFKEEIIKLLVKFNKGLRIQKSQLMGTKFGSEIQVSKRFKEEKDASKVEKRLTYKEVPVWMVPILVRNLALKQFK